MEKSSFLEQAIYQDVPTHLREQVLSDKCDEIKASDVPVKYSEYEMTQMRKDNADALIKVQELEQEKKQWLAEWKAKCKPLKELSTKLITSLRMEHKTIEQELYLFPDYSQGLMGYYDEEGHLIKSMLLEDGDAQISLNNNSLKAV